MYKIISNGLGSSIHVFHNDVELTEITSLTLNCSVEGTQATIQVWVSEVNVDLKDENVQIS